MIPTRNRKEMVSFAIESALKYSKFAEIIVVSNGDSLCGDIPEKYLSSDSIKVVRSKKRLTMPENWYFGFTNTNSKWIRFLGDDDFLVIQPEVLFDILSKENNMAIQFRSESFIWPDDYLLKSSLGDLSSKHLILDHVPKIISTEREGRVFWLNQPIGRYPGGSASSIIQRDFLGALDKSKYLFSGIAPDWNISAHFFYSLLHFSKYDVLLDCLGVSKKSSISVLRNMKPDSKYDPLLFNNNLHSRLKNFSVICPSTWLARVDSILWAREKIGLETNTSDFKLVMSALNTTPSMVKRMYKYIQTGVKITPKIKMLFYFMYFMGIFRYIKYKFKL